MVQNYPFAPPNQQSQPISRPPGNQNLNRYPQKNRIQFELFTPWFIIVGTILIGIGIMLLGFVPGDIYIDMSDSSDLVNGEDFHPEMQITSLQIGALLIGIGTIFEGLGAGLNVKAYFDLKKTK